jgi:hypothetical protein
VVCVRITRASGSLSGEQARSHFVDKWLQRWKAAANYADGDLNG